jgi:hypothetical protein
VKQRFLGCVACALEPGEIDRVSALAAEECTNALADLARCHLEI